jgi:CBS domain containing-hemolysin-like protein
MDPQISLLITYMLLSLIISAICSVLEATILSVPMSYVTTLETQGAKGWQRLKQYKTNIDRPISAILIVNTIANTVGASLVGSQAAGYAASHFSASNEMSLFVGIVSGVFTFLILVFSEIVPKTIGSTYWRKLAIPASQLIHLMVVITYVLVVLLEKITHVVGSSSNQESVTRDEVAAMVTVGTEEGVLEKKENRMIQNLLKLDSVAAHEIMTPSVVVSMAEEEMTLRDFYHDEEFKNFSRIPVYKGEESDYITGYVLRQEILERLAEDKFDTKLGELARPILSFSEDEDVSTIWEKLLEKKEHISIIIDEYGCLRGIVTLEDVIETMLGFEIVDEKDEVVDMQELAKAQWKQMQKEQHK